MTVKFGPDMTYFLWSLAAGVLLAAVYDFLRVVRRMVKVNDLIVNLTDIVFLIFSGTVVVATAYIFNNGEFRFYSLACISGAFLIYKITIGDLMVGVVVKFLFAAEKTAVKILRVLLYPIKKVYSEIKKILKLCTNILTGISKWVLGIMHIKKNG